MRRLPRRSRDDAGASAVEYGLIVFAIAAVIAVVVFAFGGAVRDMFSTSCDHIGSSVSQAQGGAAQAPASCG
jgi:pilus assembly protein Flp/PilA